MENEENDTHGDALSRAAINAVLFSSLVEAGQVILGRSINSRKLMLKLEIGRERLF